MLTNGQFILPRCGTLMFTTVSLRLLTKRSWFFDNHLAPPTRYKRECSNKFVLLNMDCGFSYFDELVTYYATLLGESLKSEPVVLRWRDFRCAFANLLLARLYLFDLILLKFHSISKAKHHARFSPYLLAKTI